MLTPMESTSESAGLGTSVRFVVVRANVGIHKASANSNKKMGFLTPAPGNIVKYFLIFIIERLPILSSYQVEGIAADPSMRNQILCSQPLHCPSDHSRVFHRPGIRSPAILVSKETDCST